MPPSMPPALLDSGKIRQTAPSPSRGFGAPLRGRDRRRWGRGRPSRRGYRQRQSHPDADTLDRLAAQNSLRDAGVQFLVPVHGVAKARGNPQRYHLVDAPDRVALGFRAVHQLLHADLVGVSRHPELACVRALANLVVAQVGSVHCDPAEVHHMAVDRDSKLRQQRLADRTDCHARRRLACAGALQHIAGVTMPELQCAAQIDMARTRAGDNLPVVKRPRLRRHLVHPHLVVAVLDHQRHGRPQRVPCAPPTG